ncbi:MAG: endonuclease NucS [Desulfurococcaceae archaeon]|nr:endonuclease NucS [Desulfurococcaceae archaeon]
MSSSSYVASKLVEVLLAADVGPEELAEVISRWFRRATIVVLCRCSIEYRGRASSRAGEAVRLVLLKQDGTVAVHEASGRDPVNWQPRADVRVVVAEDSAVLRATRDSPREELTVSIRGRAWVTVAKLGDVGLQLFGGEDDIVNDIAGNPSRFIEGTTLVAREVGTPYGRVDLILRDGSGRLVIVEVKRGRADVDAAHQLRRYVEYYSRLGLEVTGVLVAPEISGQALKYLKDHGLRYVRYVARATPTAGSS